MFFASPPFIVSLFDYCTKTTNSSSRVVLDGWESTLKKSNKQVSNEKKNVQYVIMSRFHLLQYYNVTIQHKSRGFYVSIN